MIKQIESIWKIRRFLLEFIKDLDIDQLNKIPPDFNNNIIWNIAHLIAGQQGVCYIRAGLKTWVEEDFFNAYKPGTKPLSRMDEEQVEKIKELFFSTLDILEQDYQKALWNSYPAWTTRYGLEVKSIDDAMDFLLVHEGLHLGYVMALKKVV